MNKEEIIEALKESFKDIVKNPAPFYMFAEYTENVQNNYLDKNVLVNDFVKFHAGILYAAKKLQNVLGDF